MSDIILTASIGGLAAFMVSVPAIITEIVRHGKSKNLPLVVEVRSFFDSRLSHTAAFAAGVYLHILTGVIFGAVYPAAAGLSLFGFAGAAFGLPSLLFYGLAVWFVFVFVLFPLFGFGLFGRKEGKTVWLEVLVSLFLIAILFWLAMPVFRPMYF